MEIVHERCAALDVSKADVKVCVRTPSRQRGRRHTEVRTFASTTNHLLQMRDWLETERVTKVVMEATSDYWRSPYYLLEDRFEVALVNARQVKALPGRKTDVSDAVWLCQLAECGLLRASFVPPEPIRQLRDLTRYRAVLVDERTREKSRLEKELEDAGIKISLVATDLLGVSGRRILRALIDGERDPHALADMAVGRLRPRIPDLRESLVGRFNEHHAFLCQMHLDRVDQIDRDIDTLSQRIHQAVTPFRGHITRLCTIPGVDTRVAEVIIAETGGDMSRFPTAAHLASWAGVAPGNHQSGRRRKPAKTTKGDPWLKEALGVAALTAPRTKNTYLGAQYHRLVRRLGNKQKALVAVEHSILNAVWHMLTRDADYHDLGSDYFHRLDPTAARRKAVATLRTLGYTVTLQPIENTPKAA
jgi:transposase